MQLSPNDPALKKYQRWVGQLKKLRLSYEWRQQDVADRVSFSRMQYSAIERGKCMVTFAHIYKLAKAFGVQMEELISMDIPTKKKKKGKK